jgi:hypothetical protein
MLRPGDLLDPLAAVAAAIERLRAELPGRGDLIDDSRRERLELAAGDVLRAVVQARRTTRDLEHAGVAALDEAAHALGAAHDVLGFSRRLAG